MYRKKFLIRNGRIFDGRDFVEGELAFDEKEILAVGKVDPAFRPDHILDAAGDLVCPGLVDLHTHLKPFSSPEYATDAAAVCYPFGVTAAVDAGTVAETSFESGLTLRFFPAVGIRDGKACLEKAERLLDFYGERAVGVKVYAPALAGGGAPLLREICAFAHEKGKKVMVHCTDTAMPMEELLGCLSEGDIATHVFHGSAHSAAEDGFASLLDARRRGVVLDAGIAGHVHLDYEVAAKAAERGIFPDTLGSDVTCLSAFLRGGRYGFTTALGIFRALGMKEKELLAAATSSPADAVGIGSVCGRLAPGRPSDVAVLRYADSKYEGTDRNGHTLTLEKGYLCMLTVNRGYAVYRSENF